MVVTGFQLVAVGQDYPIRPVSFTDVNIRDDFWAPRISVNRDVTVPYDFHKCEETGRIANFAIAGGLDSGGFEGIFFNDSDVFKVIEGASYCLAGHPDAKLEQYLDDLIAKIAAAQEKDGYLYTARTIGDPKYDFVGRQARWSHLKDGHELYNVGHLYEAAVAHWQTTGKRSLLDVAIKNANLICQVFGPGDHQRVGVPGHQEIEIGLIKLYRATGDEKYLKQAKFFLDMRGQTEKRKTFGAQYQDHKPVVEQKEAVGHAVRAGYLYAAMADIAALTGDDAYLNAIQGIWENIVSKKMYLTGSVGSKRHGEAFGDNYELPNETAYNETCAAIAQAFFNQRMFLLTGEAKYVDVLERIIYNGFLSGVSISGDRFFYPNPLACNGHSRFNKGVLGRSPWFNTSCCPVNIVRFVPSIAGYVYASTEDALYVNLFIGGNSRVSVADTEVSLRQETRYPWDGKVKLNIDVPHPTEFALRLRIPGWVTGRPLPSDLYRYTSKPDHDYTISLNGKKLKDLSVVNGYAELKRNWNAGDTVELDLPMDIRTVVAHDKVAADRGRVALERGPVVYCSEAIDNGGKVADLVLPTGAKLHAEHRTDLLGGVTVVTGQVQRAKRTKDGSIELVPTTLTAIPYYAWAHREVGQMAVWLANEASAASALHQNPSGTSNTSP
ncbi:MAG: glycoside hydrolase family 127 protein [Planctomycetes bacterium]|nr:glycoside hydrolase family 127 protein [Planctomycetota bacterium]